MQRVERERQTEFAMMPVPDAVQRLIEYFACAIEEAERGLAPPTQILRRPIQVEVSNVELSNVGLGLEINRDDLATVGEEQGPFLPGHFSSDEGSNDSADSPFTDEIIDDLLEQEQSQEISDAEAAGIVSECEHISTECPDSCYDCSYFPELEQRILQRRASFVNSLNRQFQRLDTTAQWNRQRNRFIVRRMPSPHLRADIPVWWVDEFNDEATPMGMLIEALQRRLTEPQRIIFECLWCRAWISRTELFCRRCQIRHAPTQR